MGNRKTSWFGPALAIACLLAAGTAQAAEKLKVVISSTSFAWLPLYVAVTLQSITVSDNVCPRGGGLFCMNGANAIIINSIFSNNEGEISFLGYNSENHVHSLYSNYNGWFNAGNGIIHWSGVNLFQDPLFSFTGDYPYSLSENSPCKDAGLNTVSNMPDWDILGNARICDGDGNGSAIVDMGAYEFGSLPVGIPDSEFRPPAAGSDSGFRLRCGRIRRRIFRISHFAFRNVNSSQ